MKKFSRKIEKGVCKTTKKVTEALERKRIAMLFLCVCLGLTNVLAQDIITMKNGEDIKAFVQEIGDVDVKYKKFDNPNGPNYTLKKAEILMIRYENGIKDIFSEEEKPVEKQEISKSESANVNNNENIETITIPENAQSRKDVIVRLGGMGFQTKITHVDNKRIYYIRYKKNGKEKDKKIKQKRVELTLSFDEKFKHEKYPLQMNMQDFSSLPVYTNGSYLKLSLIVFGTDRMSNLSQIKKNHSDIYDDFVKGQKQARLGFTMAMVGTIYIFPLYIAGLIIENLGVSKIQSAFHTYYATCVDLGVCAKYGIIVTPYNTNLTFR